ncbi:ATP-binding protein [Methanobrevibacter curvatus]|uniref:Serine-protein kinase RsbW n=1 Tax=Methanobrevibacter curvatus TaxID=49547 RepID=A0A162FAM8_9EURY|nr:ATP-binding protein [Methanobrevibacter curvatus]KZX10305.1 serine-protein kinase RsbW [Methanobrevibacter curvatus]
MEKIVVPGKVEYLSQVQEFINSKLKYYELLPKFQMQLELVIEEIFINIVKYAHMEDSSENKIVIYSLFDEESSVLTIKFVDKGIPFNPLKEEDPDLNADIENRKIGGLGLFLVKKNTDELEYKYKKGKNILTFKKSLK